MQATETNRLMKAETLRGLGSKVAFNYEDLRQRCDTYIEEIRNQAKQILTDAQQQAEQLRAEAEKKGHAQGLIEGRKQAVQDQQNAIDAAADQKTSERLQTMIPAVEAAVRALESERNQWLSTWQNTAIKLSVAIAEKLLRRELQEAPELTKEAVLEALELAAGNPRIVFHLNPSDVEFLGVWCEEIVQSMSPGGATEVVADPTITPGGCFIETKHGEIDARIETKLSRIAEELLQ